MHSAYNQFSSLEMLMHLLELAPRPLWLVAETSQGQSLRLS